MSAGTHGEADNFVTVRVQLEQDGNVKDAGDAVGNRGRKGWEGEVGEVGGGVTSCFTPRQLLRRVRRGWRREGVIFVLILKI